MAAGSEPQGPTGRRLSRRGLYIPFILLVLVMIGWSGLWFYAANRAERIVEAAIARESARGRDWRCPNRTVSGFPFRLEISCDKPQLLAAGFEGIRQEASLGGITLHATISAPGHFIAVLAPPLRVRRAEAAAFELSWKEARASLRAGLEGFADASFTLDAPVASFGGGEKDAKASAKDAAFHLRRSPGEKPGTDLVFRIGSLAFAPLDQVTANAAPMDVEVQATAPGLVLAPNQRFDTLLEAWRAGGGKARIVLAKASKGNASIDLAGTLGLDGLHRLEGNLQGRAKGLEALTGNLTRGRVDVGGLLGRLGGGQGIPVVLSFQDGRLRYGPFPIAELRPLY